MAVYTMSRTTQGIASYADSSEAKLESDKDRIRWLLERRRGRDAAISSQAIADAQGLDASTVRDLIPMIRREDNLPIGSCQRGYFTIATLEEFERHVERFNSQIATAKQRKQELAKAWNTTD